MLRKLMVKHAHDRAAYVDPVSGTHLRPKRVAPGRVLLLESDDERADEWRRALAPSQVVRVDNLHDAEDRFTAEAPDLLLVGCPVRGPALEPEQLLTFFQESDVAAARSAVYIEARRCTMACATAMLTIGACVRPGNSWQAVSGDWVRMAYATGRSSVSDDETYELAKNIAATEIADRYNLTAAHQELLRALLEEDQRREVAKLIGRSHGTVRVQLGQMRDRSQLTTAELVRETFGVAAKSMPHLAHLVR
jgi:hypothetical protein